jgi:hypothetical protein
MKRRGVNRANHLNQQILLRQLRDKSTAFNSGSIDAIPAAAEIEDRHVHHQHRILHLRLAAKHFPPTAAGAAPATVDTQFQTRWLALHLIIGIVVGLLQAQGVERVGCQLASDAKAVITLVSQNRVPRFRPEDAIDLSSIITVAR